MLKDSLLFDNIKCSHPFYDTCLDSGTYILENSLFLTTSITATHLFIWYCDYFTAALVVTQVYLKCTVSFSQHLLWPSIISMLSIQKKLKGTAFLRKSVVAPLF